MNEATKRKYQKVIAARLCWLRLEVLKMTQSELAEALKISHQKTISEYETAVIRPNMRRCGMLIALAKSKGVTQDPNGHPIDYKYLRPDMF